MLVSENISDLVGSDNMLNYKEKKKKKARVITNAYTVLSKRKRSRAPKSDIARWTSELIKENLKTPEQIAGYLAKQGKSLDQNNKNLFSILVSSKIFTGNVRVSDILTNKPLYGYIYIKGLQTRTLTNDILFLNCVFSRSIENDYIKNFSDYAYLSHVNIVNAVFCSPPFNCTGEIQKGYYQDYSNDFAAIGLQALTKENKDKVLDLEAPSYDFLFENKQFTCYGYPDGCVICIKDDTAEVVKKKVEDMKIINMISGKIVIQEKKSVIDDKVRYIDSKLIPERFCPAFLIAPKQFSGSMLFKYQYDYNMLFEDFEKVGVSKLPRNFFYWDNIPHCFDFLEVVAVTSSSMSQEAKQYIDALYTSFNDIKHILSIWAKNQLVFQRLLYKFYNSFSQKIDYDKINDIYQVLKEYIDNRDLLYVDSSYTEVMSFVNKCRDFAGYIVAQLTDEVYNLANYMRDTLQHFLAASNIDETVRNLKEIGRAIYNLSYNLEQDTRTVFPISVSPGAFLGNLAENAKGGIDYLKEFMNRMKENKNKQVRSKNDQINQQLNILQNIQSYYETVIKNSIDNYDKVKNLGLNLERDRDAIEGIYNEIMTGLNNDANVKNELNKLIVSNMMEKGNIDGVIFQGNIVDKAVNSYMLKLRDQQLAYNQRRLNLQNQQNQINTQINNLEGQSVQDIEIEDLSGLNIGNLPQLTGVQDIKGNKIYYYTTVGKTGNELQDIRSEDEVSINLGAVSSPKNVKNVNKKQLAQNRHILRDIGENIQATVNANLDTEMQSQTDSWQEEKESDAARWYTDVLLLSGVYNVKAKDWQNLSNVGLKPLLEEFPLADSQILSVVLDYKLPTSFVGYNKQLGKYMLNGKDYSNPAVVLNSLLKNKIFVPNKDKLAVVDRLFTYKKFK